MCSQESRRLTCVHEHEDDSVQPPGEFHSFVMRVQRRFRKLPVFLLAMVLTSILHAGHSVWSFNIPHQVYIVGVKTGYCGTLKGLSAKQIGLCNDFRDRMASVGDGAKKAIKECKFQFQYRRWNCSRPEKDRENFFGLITTKRTREAAFTYAITSAGVMWALARACAEGNISNCACALERRPPDLQKEYAWGGCGDNLAFGEKFGKRFMDDGEEYNPPSKKHAKTLMNLHNNGVGRKVVKESSIIECKCHGVSGSCNLKTCWRELIDFREIGNILHDKFDAAIQVELRRQQGRSILLPKRKRRAFRRQLPPIKSDLVFLDTSPDFCNPDADHGVLGTRGRKCIKDAPGTEGCRLLCCDRGYNTRYETVSKRCRCKFYWCCQVRCKVCNKRETIHTCK